MSNGYWASTGYEPVKACRMLLRGQTTVLMASIDAILHADMPMPLDLRDDSAAPTSYKEG